MFKWSHFNLWTTPKERWKLPPWEMNRFFFINREKHSLAVLIILINSYKVCKLKMASRILVGDSMLLIFPHLEKKPLHLVENGIKIGQSQGQWAYFLRYIEKHCFNVPPNTQNLLKYSFNRDVCQLVYV